MDANEALKQIEELEKVLPTPAAETEKRLTLVEKIWKQSLTEKDVPDDMYQAFVRSVLTNVPFTYAFTAMKGELTVVFSEPRGNLAKRHSTLRSKLEPDQMEEISQIAILTHLEKITSKRMQKPLYERSDDTLSGDVPDTNAGVSDMIHEEYATFISNQGESISRIIPSMWLILSGLWNFMLQREIPTDF